MNYRRHKPKEEAKVDTLFVPKKVKAYTRNHLTYMKAIDRSVVTICYGPSGTGKTYMACYRAAQALRDGEVKQIVLTRPALECGEKLGFMPGEAEDKMSPYLLPLLDALKDFMPVNQLRELMDAAVIEIAPLGFMRGRTLRKAFIILDEGQNTTIPQMKMFLTRFGDESKVVVLGDVSQSDLDLNRFPRTGLGHAVERLGDIEGISIVKLEERDQMRHPLIEKIIANWED